MNVQARVKGYLEAVLFKEGDFVKKGDPLYQIEKGLFQAAVDDAQGALERAKAAKVLTEVELQRKEELVAKQAGTAVARDIALSADEQAKGTILSAQANLETANINLGYTDIVSPIDGKISRTSITPGNVVGPESGSLTLIVSQDPMYVTFPVSQRDLLQAQVSGRQSEIKDIKVKVRFADGSTYDHEGSINFHRCVGQSCHRHGDRTRHDRQSRRHADRWPTGERDARGRNARRESGRSAGGADRRSERHLSCSLSRTERRR